MPKVLIIEENQRVADVLTAFLRKRGHEADIAADGISAIRSFAGGNYDLLLVNLELPFMTGDAVCRKIRESAKGKSLPIIMISGALKDEAGIEKLKAELSLQAFLAKPFTSVVLSETLDRVLPEGSAGAAPARESEPAPAADPAAIPQTSEAAVEPQEASEIPIPEESAAAPQPQPAAPDQPDQISPDQPRKQASPRPSTIAESPAASPRSRGPAPMKGNLENTPFEKVLFYLFAKKGTGILTVSRDDLKRVFFFVQGGLLDVETAAGDDDFGGFLQRRNLAEEIELRQYRELRKQGKDPRDIFVKMGCLTPDQFQNENLLFLRDRLSDCFAWNTGSVLFEWMPTHLKEMPSAAAFMSQIFYQGLKTKLTPAMTSNFLEEKGRLFAAKTADFYEYQNHLAQEPGAAAVLDQIDGQKTCFDIVSAGEPDKAAVLLYTLDYLKGLSYSEAPAGSEVPPPFPLRERTVRQAVREQETFEDLGGALSALEDEVAAIGEMKPADAPAPEASEGLSSLEQELKEQWETIKDKNYYEIFGMKQNAFSFDKCKKVYFDLTRTYGPDKFFASSSEVMTLAEEFLAKVSNAYETLSNVVSKENYDEMLAQQEQVPSAAEDKEFYEQIQFQSGKVFVEQGQYDSAEKAFVNCVNIDPNKPEYLAYLALAVYNNPANKANQSAKRRAKDLVNKSLQLGKLSIAYALKGSIYLDEGGMNFAEAEFKKALRLNPNNKTALKKLEQIAAKREEEKKGLFQRMFK